MRLEQFEYLLTVAQTHSMSLAAQELHVTVQNISKNIKALENELQAPLFLRTSHGVTLTNDGENVLRYAQRIFDTLNQLKADYHLNIDEEFIDKNLNILTSASISKFVLKTVQTLSVKNPDLNPLVFIKEALEINKDLLPYQNTLVSYDIIMTSLSAKMMPQLKDLRENYHIYFLREDFLGLQMSENSPLAKEQKISIKVLPQLPLAAYSTSPDKSSQMIALASEYGVPLTPVFVTNSPQGCTEYIKANNAYGLVTLPMLKESFEPMPEGIVIVPLKEKLALIHLMLVKRQHSPAQFKYFKNLMFAHYPQHTKLY